MPPRPIGLYVYTSFVYIPSSFRLLCYFEQATGKETKVGLRLHFPVAVLSCLQQLKAGQQMELHCNNQKYNGKQSLCNGVLFAGGILITSFCKGLLLLAVPLWCAIGQG